MSAEQRREPSERAEAEVVKEILRLWREIFPRLNAGKERRREERTREGERKAEVAQIAAVSGWRSFLLQIG